MTLAEVPTGAIADLIGKKTALTIAFFLIATGNMMLAFSPSFLFLAVSVLVASLGFAFYSGAYEAIVYDTLKEEKRESIFDTVIARINSVQLMAMAMGGLASGLLYSYDPRAPFIATGLAALLGCFLTIFLREPAIDSEQYSWASFINQNKQGLNELRAVFRKEWIAPLMLGVGSLWVLSDEMLETILALEFGFSELYIGPFFALLFLIAAVASQLTPWLKRIFGASRGLLVLTVVMGLSYLVSPFVGLVAGGAILILRESLARNIQNLTSVVINRSVRSRYRSTAISSFNMVKNVPYALTAFGMGYLMDQVTARWFSLYLGVAILIGVLLLFIVAIVQRKLMPDLDSNQD
jgi:MFS family permease